MNPDHQTTRRRSWQAVMALACALLGSVPALGAPRGPYAAQLARECDELIELAVKRPYGWGWGQRLDLDPRDRRPEVQMHPPGTPGAGLVLLWAGTLLNEPKYIEAAVHVARAVVVSQTPNGMVLSNPTFAASAGGREPPDLVPQRAGTRAGLTLLLACIGADPSRDEMFRRAAFRASIWLTRQQAGDGGWPTATPQDARERVPTLPARLIRLDSADFRDSTCALLLAADVINDRPAGRGATSATQKLISLQLSGAGRLSGLWSTWYRLDGTLEDTIPDWPAGADMRASKWSLETLLAAALLGGDEDARGVARDAAKSLAALHDDEGLWRRIYPLAETRDEQAPATGESVFQTPDGSVRPSSRGEFGLDRLLKSFELLQNLGPAQFSVQLSQSATIQERLANAICGFDEDPFATDWPDSPQRAKEYLIAHSEKWRSLEGAPPDNLDERVHRLYALLLRARLEQQFGEIH